ncbi:rhomboid family intramembrane serine protease [Flavobacterium sp. RHBU_3]|uniref:rhomboid family intramembrane serine protease n=1 Tax=Flavobacterium sp. RHBU_3 TaxID=3391184 RepID=UPI0039855699
MMKMTDTVKQLIIINVIVFLCSQFVPQAYEYLSLYFPANPNFKVWQVFTSMFMHAKLDSSAGITHILFNMITLWMFGSPLEHFWGAKRFVTFYLLCGVGSAIFYIGIDYYTFYKTLNTLTASGFSHDQILSVLSSNQIDTRWYDVLGTDGVANLAMNFNTTAVGASGALYGVMVAFAFMFPEVEMMMIFFPIPIKTKWFVPGLIAFDLIMGLRGKAVIGQGDGVAHFAHLGGALVGFLLMMYWRNKRFNHTRWN